LLGELFAQPSVQAGTHAPQLTRFAHASGDVDAEVIIVDRQC
jgi:hypothetical protein